MVLKRFSIGKINEIQLDLGQFRKDSRKGD
jgi:hypothetical protein